MLKFAVKKSAKYIFHDAVANKDISRLKFLLQNNREGFKIDELDEDGLTALQRSCFIGNLKLVQLLVTYGANIDIQDREGWSVLHASAVAGNSSILRYLVCMGADVTTRNDLGELPIDLANDIDCVIILAEAMITAGYRELIDSYFAQRPSLKAAIEDKLRTFSKRHAFSEPLSTGSSSPLSKIQGVDTHKKIHLSYSDKTVALQEEPSIVNATESRQPLGNILNTSSNKGDGVLLIERGGQSEGGRTRQDNRRAKQVVCKKCQGKKRLSTASSCSLSSDSSGSSSSDSAYVSSVSLLSENLPSGEALKNEHSHDEDYTNPVFYSVLPKQSSTPAPKHRFHNCRKHEKHYKQRIHSSPAPVSSSKRHRILNKIKEQGNVNGLNESGLSLLHVMASQGDTESVKILLENGAEVNRQALNGSTPLHEAAQSGSVESILILLSYEADLFAENDNGLLPIDKAKGNDVKLLLHKAMAMN